MMRVSADIQFASSKQLLIINIACRLPALIFTSQPHGTKNSSINGKEDPTSLVPGLSK
jgi:hypothetical protein